ncbi:MAG: VOC family protein [Acidobacteria bacterium]|nr:VOC family protein [Acidobacteriota bacterium]MBI3279296.1 VOC family protein [Acidobacteriota bacterium]
MAVKPIPEGHYTVTPYLTVPGVARLIDFLKQVFGAEEIHERMSRPDGAVMHAEVKIGDSPIMLGEPAGAFDAMPATLYVYVEDTDTVYRKALEAGATSLMQPSDQFYGDRNAGFSDPAGNRWFVATHIEDVAPEELKRRAEAAAKTR